MAAGQKAFAFCLIVMALASLLSANPLLSLACVAAFGWLWFGALRSPLLTVMAAYLTFQWLQATGGVWLANGYGADLGVPQAVTLRPSTSIYRIRQTTDDAVLFGLAAISLISLGFRLVPGTSRGLRQLEVPYRPLALFAAYAALLVVHLFAGPFVGGGLAQPIIILGELRLLFAALLLYRWVLKRTHLPVIAAVVILELIVGFSGFFSGFKDIFFVIAVALMTLAPVMWKRVAPLTAACVAATLLLGGVWTAVKSDYRSVLNQGKASQAVTIGFAERWDALQSLVGSTTQSDLQTSLVNMAGRVSYSDFLAVVMNRIPAVQPHADGEVWGAALRNALVPRLLNPNKPLLKSDSELTMRYTGMRISSDRQATSISIGYAGDTYVDFGIFGACLLFLLMGVTYGVATAFVSSRFEEADILAAVGTVIVLLSNVAHFEMSIVKLLASFLWTVIVLGAFAAIAWPTIRPLLAERERRPERTTALPIPAREASN